jgi:SAM-dependent methyltransferase
MRISVPSTLGHERAGMSKAYGDDLAYIHDTGFGDLARNAAPILVEALRRRGIGDGLVVDLGCGSGLLARGLSESGFDVLGIDISAPMIALARERVPKGRFVVGSLLRAELPSCVAVAAVGEGFNYLFDRANTKHGLSRLFRRIYEALNPKGLLLFDVAEPGRVPGGGPRRTYVEGEDWVALVTAEEDRRRGLLTRRITSFRRVGELYRRDLETHRLRLLRRSELASELRGLGFRVRFLSGYGPSQFAPGHVGFLAGRP